MPTVVYTVVKMYLAGRYRDWTLLVTSTLNNVHNTRTLQERRCRLFI